MSIDIHISNYEEFLYSYVDGELNAEESAALEAFVATHPQVRAELDQLLAVKLTPDNPVFDGKASLYRQPAAPERNYSSVLLEYIDGELAPAEVRALEAFMEEHPALRAELAVWEKTRLQANLTVSYGDKSALYRHAEKQKVVRMDRRYWWAAAAMLAGSLFLLRNAFQPDDTAVLPPAPMAKVQPAAPAAQPQAATVTPVTPAENIDVAALAEATTAKRAADAAKTAPVKNVTVADTRSAVNTTSPSGNEASEPVSNNALAALNTLERSAPRQEAPVVNAGISSSVTGIREQATTPVKASIDVQHTASLATAAPAEPPGELILSVTGNGIESKVLDKFTNVAKIFAKKRNNR